MSGLIVGLVLRQPITDQFTSEAKFIAAVYADHAWEDGTHAYPAVDTVAKITGYASRTVQRHLRALVRMGMLIPAGNGPRGTGRYDFPLHVSSDGSVRLAITGGVTVSPPENAQEKPDSGDTQSPRQPVGGDSSRVTAPSGDTSVTRRKVTRINNPLINSLSSADFEKMQISQAYQLPTLRMYRDATGFFPGAASWEFVHTFITKHQLTAEKIRDASREWSIRGYKPANVKGILEWARDGVPQQQQKGPKNGNNTRTGNKSSTKSTGQTTQTSPTYSASDLAAAERVRARNKARLEKHGMS